MDSYKVEISPHALKQLDDFILYVKDILKCRIMKIYLLNLLKIPRLKFFVLLQITEFCFILFSMLP